MSRPKKWRKVCSLPENGRFGPLNTSQDSSDHVIMSIDEYETIRLIDLERLTQEECAVLMKVARTTVQAIYNEARRKLAKSLVKQLELRIEGGDVKLCEGNQKNCSIKNCCEEMKKKA